jgi:tetraacyldisaccharide 4'-kinase
MTSESGRFRPFVISVGNIAFGGRGKTPTVAFIVRLLIEMGERPAVLSRGYGRRRVEDGVVVVSDGRRLLADLDRAGDEPLMLARDLPGVPVLVCEQRAIAGAMARHTFGATALVLDDGFQHRQMARDVDIVLVTPADLTGRRAPFGRLRESSSTLRRADAIVWTEKTTSEVISPAIKHETTSEFVLVRHPSPLPVPPGSRVFVLAGIAGPDRFAHAAVEAGYVIAGSWTPGDHHRYTTADVRRLAREVEATNAAGVLTTSKDAVRLMPLRPLPFAIFEWPLRVTIEPADQFAAWLRRRRDEARAARAAQAESA